MTSELDFKQALRLDMERKGLSEAALGKALKISQQAVNKWIARGFPPLSQLDNLLAVLGEGSEVSKLSHKAIYSSRSRTPRNYIIFTDKESDRSIRFQDSGIATYNSDGTTQQPSRMFEAWQTKLKSLQSQQDDSSPVWAEFKDELPEELHGNLDRQVPTERRPITYDYASANVVAEIVRVRSAVASHNSSIKLLQLITYAQMVNPKMVKLLIVVTEEPRVNLNSVVNTAAKTFDVRLAFVKNGREAAQLVLEAEKGEIPELLEPDE